MTTKLSLFYKLTQTEVLPPTNLEMERKNDWVKTIQKTVEADYKPLIMKVTYELFNPEVEDQQRFFNGTCIKYYAIQDMGITEGKIDYKTLKAYREEILDGMLGYDVRLITKTTRKRKSTKDFKTVQKWYKFLKELEEEVFFTAGYEFPSSEDYWKLVEMYGHEEAERISVDKLFKLNKSRLCQK